MASLNKVLLMGNITRDPDVRYTPSGTAVCTLGLATNRRYTTSQGEQREETCFVDIDVFGRQAEACGNYLQKGSPALVEGRLRLDQWEDRRTGDRRSRLKVTAQQVQFLGGPGSRGTFNDSPDRGENTGGQTPPRQNQPQNEGGDQQDSGQGDNDGDEVNDEIPF